MNVKMKQEPVDDAYANQWLLPVKKEEDRGQQLPLPPVQKYEDRMKQHEDEVMKRELGYDKRGTRSLSLKKQEPGQARLVQLHDVATVPNYITTITDQSALRRFYILWCQGQDPDVPLPLIEDLLCANLSPHGEFLGLKASFSSLVLEWHRERVSTLVLKGQQLLLYRFNNTPQPAMQSGPYPSFTLEDLELAINVWYCAKCKAILFYPTVLEHQCVRSIQDFNLHLHPLYDPDNHISAIVIAYGQDPAHTSRATMDKLSLQTRLTCADKACNNAVSRKIFTWRAAIRHAFNASQSQPHERGWYFTPQTLQIRAIEDSAARNCYNPALAKSYNGVEKILSKPLRCTWCPGADLMFAQDARYHMFKQHQDVSMAYIEQDPNVAKEHTQVGASPVMLIYDSRISGTSTGDPQCEEACRWLTEGRANYIGTGIPEPENRRIAIPFFPPPDNSFPCLNP
ncbi:hypothetical protein EIP86_003502 [Pleurotus ostreatoroseus]|nr:hypothetical protein EIP86_003502 [Pleurotus ostreatoroseus]